MTPRLSRCRVPSCPPRHPPVRPATRPCPTPAGGYRLGGPEYRRISVALFAAGLATFALLYSTQPLLPALARDFHLSAGQSALSVSLCTVGLGLALLVAGPVSEVLGRTVLIHASLWSSAVVALLCAVAPSWPVLLGLRALLGITLAGLPAVAVAYLREEVHEDSHAKATGLYIGGTALGGMAGRLVAGGLADLGGWRWRSAASGRSRWSCAGLARWLLPASRRFVARRPRPAEPARDDRPAGPRAGAAGPLWHRRDDDGRLRRGLQRHGLPPGCGAVRPEPRRGRLCLLRLPPGSLSSAYAGRLADRHGRRVVVPAACAVTAAGGRHPGPPAARWWCWDWR